MSTKIVEITKTKNSVNKETGESIENFKLKIQGSIDGASPNVLALFNKGDERFSQNTRFAWINKATKEALLDNFNMTELPEIEGESIIVDIELVYDNRPMVLQLNETVDVPQDMLKLSGQEFEEALMKRAKKYTDKEGKTQYILSKEGKAIFSTVTPVFTAKHVRIEDTQLVSESEFKSKCKNLQLIKVTKEELAQIGE